MNNGTIPVTTPSPELPSAANTLRTEDSDHRGNGKIAQLPKVLRDQVNRMLDDGVPYKAIIEKLEQSSDPPLPYKILEMNISRWKDNGYQKYLRHQEWRDQLRILRENGSDMSELTEGPKFQETLIQIALTEIFRVLQQGEVKPDSLNYIRLFNALARLNREALGLRKYNDHLAKEQAQLKQLDIHRELVEDEHLAIVDRTDRIMEMPRPRPLWSAPAEGSAAPAARGDRALVAPPQAQTNDRSTISPYASRLTHHAPASLSSIEQPQSAAECPIENRKSKIKNPSLPSCPCRSEIPDAQVMPSHASRITHHGPESSIQNPASDPHPIQNQNSKIEHCLDCGSPLPRVQPHSLRRPEDHCPNPNCGMRLPDIGLCYQPGFDHCLNCGATQPALLPGGERPRPNCHKCGIRLHNPELPDSTL
jgi:hypothetical protein